MKRIAVVGGGPAGLMAAEAACAAGVAVDLYEGKGSVGRKFLIAGKGGLNLTHSDDAVRFSGRYGSHGAEVAHWLNEFGSDEVRNWARDLGIETFVGTSGRVFPLDMKAAPLLRAWVRRLRTQGVTFHVHHDCTRVEADRTLQFQTASGSQHVKADAVVLALGGGSWPQLGSDGRWIDWFDESEVAPLRPANCGFDANWSDVFAKRFAGQPVKSVKLSTVDVAAAVHSALGEFVVTASGIEGSAVYALAACLRDVIARDAAATLNLDLAPDIPLEKLAAKLQRDRKGRSLTEHLRRTIGLEGVKVGLLYECVSKEKLAEPAALAASIKDLSIPLIRPRPLAEAISTAGGVRFAVLDNRLMLRSRPGIFFAGEMIDWEAPTGGYLLTACLASGRVAGNGAASWLKQ